MTKVEEKQKYTPTIGLEIHAELKTNTKMFSNSKNDPDEENPNANIHPIDLGHPGTLPTINKKAVEHMVKIGLAVGGEIADFTEFDRKNYFYPDIPKGYQISQFKYPIVSGGVLGGITLTRIHLEEDTGLSKHDRGDFSLVDYNRAGIPLMELVTEPVIHSAEEAVKFAKSLQMLLRYLGVADANMEKGEMRVEANISVSSDPEKLGTKVEIKNLNSFKIVEKAINFEIKRMTKLLEEGKGDEIVQETRGFDEAKQKTFSQRRKETSDDYRYFPEPDLPKMKLHEIFDFEKIEDELPELPWERRDRLVEEVGVDPKSAEIFVANKELSEFFDGVLKCAKGPSNEFVKLASNYITSDVVSLTKGGKLPAVSSFCDLIKMIETGKISSRGAKDILAILVKDGGNPEKIAQEKGLIQESDKETLKEMVSKILETNPKAVEEFKAGKENALQFLVGQGMKESKGSANPQILKKLFEEEMK